MSDQAITADPPRTLPLSLRRILTAWLGFRTTCRHPSMRGSYEDCLFEAGHRAGFYEQPCNPPSLSETDTETWLRGYDSGRLAADAL